MARHGKPNVPTASTPLTASTKADAEVTDPFTAVPSTYRPILNVLDRDRIHVFHIDSTPADLKRRVFMVPVWMNAVFVLLLLVRLYYAVPFYFRFVVAYFGYGKDPWIDANQLPWVDFLSLVAWRIAVVAFDIFLSTKVLSWPIAFCFAAPASPVNWRLAVGFQDKEIISRKSRTFHRNLKTAWTTDDLLSVKIYAIEALSQETVSKTGYTLIAETRWELDFAAMIKAQEVVRSRALSPSALHRLVLAFHSGTWHAWHLEEGLEEPASTEEDPAQKLKKLLQRQRKQELFYRYIELIQYETSSPGAGTDTWKARLMKQLEEMFDKAGLNLASVINEMGGIDKMPGLGTEKTA